MAQARHTHSKGWHFSTREEAELVGLSCICQLRQQQQEPLGTVDTQDEDELDELSVLTDTGPTGSKERFLDRFAELFAWDTKQKAASVSSTGMIECGNKVKIYVSRNAPFGSKDNEFVVELQSCLRAINESGIYSSASLPARELTLRAYQVSAPSFGTY